MGTFTLLALFALQSPTPTLLAPGDPTVFTFPQAMNAAGLIVGSAPEGLVSHAVEWTDAATLVDLDAGDTAQSSAVAVNASGDVAGAVCDVTSGACTPFRRLASDGVITTLHPLAGATGPNPATARGIDDAGDVVGASNATPVIWPAGAVDAVALPLDAAFATGSAAAVAPAGHIIVGVAQRVDDGADRAVAWVSDGAGGFTAVVVAFPTLDAFRSTADAVNDAGRIGGDLDDEPMVWDQVVDGDSGAVVSFATRTLPRLGSGGSVAAVSASGIAAGADSDANGTSHAVLWQENNGTFSEVDLGVGQATGVDDALLVCGLENGAAGTGAVWQLPPPGNHAPVTAPDVVTAHLGPADALLVAVDAGDPRAVLLNDTDPDGDRLTIVEADTPLTTLAGATITFDVDGGFTYVPFDRTPGTDFVAYNVTDGTLTTPSTLTIEIVDAAPTVVDGAAHFHPAPSNSFTYDSTLDGLSFLTLASDADGDPIGIVEAETTVTTAHGSFTVGADGFFTYQPAQSFVGVDALLVHVTDGLADPVVAGIALAVENQPPVENAPLVLEFNAGATGNLITNASDADGDSVGAVAATIPTTNGIATVTADGTVTWQSNTGTPEAADETFTAELTDFWSTSEVPVTVSFGPVAPPFRCGNGPAGAPCADPNGLGFTDCACNASTPADVFTVALLALLVRRGRRSARPSA